MDGKAQSPASSGPAGSHFEGQVAAHYLLSMLAGAEPRGLPGTMIDRIELQRAADGYPLDDVIVHGRDAAGIAVLEIQVKRSISFAPSDSVFRSVVGQITESSSKTEFGTSRYELAIAIARTSRKIDGAYREVLTWARQMGDSATLADRIERPGLANADMRKFVQTFKSHLCSAGVSDDAETVWRLLHRLHILVFDFTAAGSASEQLALERAVRVLHPDDAFRAGELWSTLVGLALEIAASGGDRDRNALINDLREKSFRLAGERRYALARAAIAEASEHSLADIDDRVGDVKLTRVSHAGAVQEALDGGRYVEIRGDAGVGKSAVLKHLAEQIKEEAQVLVLSPNRTPPKGWAAMRSAIGFDGSARDLLSDMAGDGGAILFVDNLDFFADDERTTVRDLVREAANMRGVSVIVTARREFGEDEPNWLPPDALARLGCASPVVIDELTETEVEELRFAAPSLIPLLDDNHPARAVSRNLFRLARLANRPGNDPVPRTEVEMATQWWKTADGRMDGTHRARQRVLKKMALQALSDPGPVDVSDEPSDAIDALVVTQTLRDLGDDKVLFMHDVLREWAIGNLVQYDPCLIQSLPLQKPAAAALVRGIEIAGRALLEQAADSRDWQSLLEGLSREDVHGSWRRSALLALVRSEISNEVLTRASDVLFSERARVLRELIRTVIAAEVRPAAQVFTAAGFSSANIPDSVNLPAGPSWPRLVGWLLLLGDKLPASAIPDVIDLYTTWSVGLFGQDQFTPLILRVIYRWLTEVETCREKNSLGHLNIPFGGELNYDQLPRLESDLRSYFVLFCSREPKLAAQYLQALIEREHNENAVRSVLKFRGSLAQAAPYELGALTIAALIPKRDLNQRYYREESREPFGWHGCDLLPASPAQGPFFELLTNAPKEGLAVIHRLVEHAVMYRREGRGPGDDAIEIVLDGELRAFPWTRTYNWSREGAGYHCLNSALMALEAWGHRRIEAGDAFEVVLADVLGPRGSAAAYLLVAVDLVLSHWPKSREAAIPFLACPELLCIDQERKVHDSMGTLDIFGIKALQKEPKGEVDLDSLRKRPSRKSTLNDVLGMYATFGPVESRERLMELLQDARERVGKPDGDSDLSDPALMVVYALNLIDPANWNGVSIELEDGSPGTGYKYESPPAEMRHFEAFQKAAQRGTENTNMQVRLSLVVDDRSRCSAELAAAAVRWAQGMETVPDDDDPDVLWMREEAIVIAAMIAMRDGDDATRAASEEWASGVFAHTLQEDENSERRFRTGLRHNPIAIAFVGMIYAIKHGVTTLRVRDLLDVAVGGKPAAAHGLRAAATTVAEIDERLPRALLRCAFASCVWAKRDWNTPDAEIERLAQRHRKGMLEKVNAESEWLAGKRREPSWPEFPPLFAQSSRVHRIPAIPAQSHQPATKDPGSDKHADHQAAAVWLKAVCDLLNVARCPWLHEMARNYINWTAAANGAKLEADEEIENAPQEWNHAYLHLLAHCLPTLTLGELKVLAIEPICSLPDEPFFDIVAPFLRSIDEVYFNDCLIEERVATEIRSAFASRLVNSSRWRYIGGKLGASIEMHIGPAISSMFFGQSGFVQAPSCYLLPKSIERLDPFMAGLETLVRSGPCLFVAIVTMNLLEVSPKSNQLPFMLAAAMTWLESFPDYREFWVDYSIGRRVCAWVEKVWLEEPNLLDVSSAARLDVDRLLAALVSLGVAEARRLEESLAATL